MALDVKGYSRTDPRKRDSHAPGVPPTKRTRRSERAVVPTSHLHLSFSSPSRPRTSGELPAQRSQLPLPGMPPVALFPPSSLPDSFFLPHLEEGFLVPRVASSVHMNELVAKYSTSARHLGPPHWGETSPLDHFLDLPSAVRPLLLPPAPCPPNLAAVLGVPLAESMARLDHGCSASMNDGPSPWQVPSVYLNHSPSSPPVPALATPGVENAACEPASICNPRDQAGAAEGVAAARDGVGASLVGNMEEGWQETADRHGHDGETSPLVVEGLKLEEETRRAVERWLRDCLDAMDGDLLHVKAAEAEEGSLPQWLLQELGESEAESEDAPAVRRLVRVDSHGSSSNVPTALSGGRDGSAFKVCADQAVSSGRGRLEAEENMETQQELGTQQCAPEVSTHSSLGEHEEEQRRDADEVMESRCSRDDGCSGLMMKRSFSTWMKDLFGGPADAFEVLEDIRTPLGAPAMLFQEEPVCLDGAWRGSGGSVAR